MRTLILAFLALPLFGQPADKPDYLNPDLPAEQRAKDLVSRMVLEEKVLQMQDQAPAIPRLGIPAYGWWNEALHGVARAGQATVFPQAIGLAATWDTGLMHRIAGIISTEARAKYNEALRNDNHERYRGLTFWSPNINIFRDPRWGRGQETYGEDPFLTSRMAVEFIRGMQGDDPHYLKVVATAKHYAVHSGPEPARHRFDAHPAERDLNETYLPAFRASVVEGKVASIMCAYNSVNGEPACVNDDLLWHKLRRDWGFQGYVVSDCGAIRDIYAANAHHFVATVVDAAGLAVREGTDLTCGGEYAEGLIHAVKAEKIGRVSPDEIDRSLERLFTARFKLGMFDPPERVPFNAIPYSEVDSAAHRQVAIEAARKSIVLLTNRNRTLPLGPDVKKIAVLGPSADDPVSLLGNYNGISARNVTPLEGIETQYAGKAEVRFAPGATYTSQTPSLVPACVLTPPEGSGHGLQAEYFDNADFQGEPKLLRVEPRIFQQADLPDPAVAAAFPDGGYSVRWSGTLRVSASGDYAFSSRGGSGPSGIRISLDGQELAAPAPTAPAPTAPAPAAPLGHTGAGRATSPQFHARLEAGRAYKLRVEYQPKGAGGAQLMWLPPAAGLLAEAIDAVKNSDVAVVFVGLTPYLEGEEMPVTIPGFAGGDRTRLDLPVVQENLVEAAISTGKPVVVVLTSGSAVAANFAGERAAAVLEAWYGGEEIGAAIAETLAGANNPSGRLPVTFYRGVEQLPPFEEYAMKGRTYRYFKGNPAYGFGFGLSYSTFLYSDLRTSRAADGARIAVSVKNDSAREGDEVVQLYVDGPGGADNPIRSLRGFERIHLGAGESRDVEFHLAPEDVPLAPVRIGVGGGQPVAPVAYVQGML
jgi:beta-glucosidase